MPEPGLGSFISRSQPDNIGKGIRQAAGKAKNIVDAIRDPSKFMSSIRSGNLPAGGEVLKRTLTSATVAQSGERDWRVSLSVPNISAFDSPMLAPLSETGNKLIFPYTPTVIMSHSASYGSTNPTHSNYTYHNYISSQVDVITVVGEFVIENSQEGQYWIAALHYLRSVSKMFYGDKEHGGNPPPIVKLNGYGDYVLNQIPVVVTNFTVELQPDVDYIECPVSAGSGTTSIEELADIEKSFGITFTGRTSPNINSTGATSWVPTRSNLTVTLQPIYSRKTISQFSLSNFVAGTYVTNGKGFI